MTDAETPADEHTESSMSMLHPSNERPDADGTTTPQAEQEYDALAELFLGESANQRETPPLRLHDPDDAPAPSAEADSDHAAPAPRPAEAQIEALVLGHLPVLAGPWVAQYARFLADTRGEAIALVRIAGDQASIDLYSDLPRASRNAAPTLHAAIEEAARVADRWIFRVDAVSEPSLAACPAVDAVTLLCGADDAAIVSAYRTIKRVLTPEGGEGAFDDDPEAPRQRGPARRVVIIGAAEEKARQAADKLRGAAQAFLDAGVEAIAGPAQLGPSSGATIYRGPAEASPEELADRVRASLRRSPDTGAATAPVSATAPAPTTPSTHEISPDASPAPQALPGPLFERVPGLRHLPIRCPYDESIELAVDADRRLHLLAAYSPVACRAMSVVAAWAMDHAALFDRVLPAGGYSDEHKPIRRLFVERACEARRLLDTDYKVHLMTPVAVEDKTAWCCVPLNE